MGCHFLLQGIFPTQGLNPGLSHCRQMLYRLSHQGSQSEEELKNLLMKVKEESEKVGLKLNIQKIKIMASGPITSREIDGETVETVSDFIFLGSKSLQMVIAAMKLKDTYSLEGSYDQPQLSSVQSLSRVRLFAIPWIVACPKLLRPWDFQGKSIEVGCYFLLQGIFPTQGLNPGLSYCRQMLYHLSHQGSLF